MIGDAYATLPQLKSYLKITDTNDDDELKDALNSASRGIEEICHRQFNTDNLVSSRVYRQEGDSLLIVDDFHTSTGLIVKTDDGDNGTYATTWATTDFLLSPSNGIVNGQPGWPYWLISPTRTGLRFPAYVQRPAVQVTANWGWADVPAAVKQACLIIAAETFKLKDAPFGVAGFGDFGAVRVRDNPMVMRKLQPYERDSWLVVTN